MKLRIIVYLMIIIFCVVGFWVLWLSQVGRNDDLGLTIKQEIAAIGQIIKIKWIERKVVVGTTTRREFEKLFNAELEGGISNLFCSTDFYCHEHRIILKVDFDDKGGVALGGCNPDAKIINPIVIERRGCATD